MNHYYTTSSSTLAGLSARALSSSLYFRETKNAIISKSLYKDLYRSRPSQLFMSLFPSEKMLVDLWLPIFGHAPELKRFFLIHAPYYSSYEKFISNLIENISITFDSHSFYDFQFNELISVAVDATLKYANSTHNLNLQNISDKLLELLKTNTTYYTKITSFYSVINNNHFSKISDVPDNFIVEIPNTLDLESDWRNLSVINTQIPPKVYMAGGIYRSVAIDREYQLLSQNYYTYLGSHISNPAEYNGYNSENYPEPRFQEGDDILNISLINARKGIYR